MIPAGFLKINKYKYKLPSSKIDSYGCKCYPGSVAYFLFCGVFDKVSGVGDSIRVQFVNDIDNIDEIFIIENNETCN